MKNGTLILLLLCLISFGQRLLAQTSNDSTYRSVRLAPRFGINVQKGYGVECGVYLNRFYTKYPDNPEMTSLPYSSSGFFLSSEVNVINRDQLVIGPKMGWELSEVGETYACYFGAEFINYTDFTKYSPALTLKIGIPLMWLNIGYGYTLFLETSLKDDIGEHRLAITYTINGKANREYRRLKENLKKAGG
jgi:hypothetical protein